MFTLIMIMALMCVSIVLINSVHSFIANVHDQYEDIIDELEYERTELIDMKDQLGVWIAQLNNLVVHNTDTVSVATHTHTDSVGYHESNAVHHIDDACDDTCVLCISTVRASKPMLTHKAQTRLDDTCDSTACAPCEYYEAIEAIDSRDRVLERTYEEWPEPKGMKDDFGYNDSLWTGRSGKGNSKALRKGKWRGGRGNRRRRAAN